jgi:hypothetical protein
MKKNHSLIIPILLLLSSAAYAIGYLDKLRGIDQGILCLVVWFAPAVVVVLFSMGAFLYASGDPANRILGKNYMQNSLAGLFISILLMGLAFALVPALKIETCLGVTVPEKKCADAKGQCGCPPNQVCKSGSLFSGVDDCPTTCCKECVPKEKTCTELGYRCGGCPAGKVCKPSAALGCDSGQKCCECVDEKCTDKNYVCGCPDGQVCESEKPELVGCESTGKTCCAKCIECCKTPVETSTCTQCMEKYQSNLLCYASNCKDHVWPSPWCMNCHDIPGCHYTGGPIDPGPDQPFWWGRCYSCCSGAYPAKSCDKYLTKEACEENPCQVSKGGCVVTGCKWSCKNTFDSSNTCCSPA